MNLYKIEDSEFEMSEAVSIREGHAGRLYFYIKSSVADLSEVESMLVRFAGWYSFDPLGIALERYRYGLFFNKVYVDYVLWDIGREGLDYLDNECKIVCAPTQRTLFDDESISWKWRENKTPLKAKRKYTRHVKL